MLQIQIFTFNPIQENTYVLHNGHEAIVIDPGCYFPSEREELQKFLLSKKLEPVMLLNTHCHLDHVFGNKWVYDTYNLELRIHRLEEPVLAAAPESGVKFGVPFDNYKANLHFFNEGDMFSIGEEVLEVIHTPGHSPGSVCFYCKGQQFLIGGDVLFRSSIGRTDLPRADFGTLEKSIRNKLYKLPDATVVYPGHGGSTTIGYEKRHNPFISA